MLLLGGNSLCSQIKEFLCLKWKKIEACFSPPHPRFSAIDLWTFHAKGILQMWWKTFKWIITFYWYWSNLLTWVLKDRKAEGLIRKYVTWKRLDSFLRSVKRDSGEMGKTTNKYSGCQTKYLLSRYNQYREPVLQLWGTEFRQQSK